LCSKDEILDSTLPVYYDKWTFVAAVYDDNEKTAKIFVDGYLVEFDSQVSSLIGIGNLIFGQAPNNLLPANGFRGKLDNFFVYSSALSTYELNFIFQRQQFSPYSPVVGNAGFAAVVSNLVHFSIPSDPLFQNRLLTETNALTSFSLSFWFKMEFLNKNRISHLIRKQTGVAGVSQFELNLFEGVESGNLIRKLTYILADCQSETNSTSNILFQRLSQFQ
jgi:hypothetical protein